MNSSPLPADNQLSVAQMLRALVAAPVSLLAAAVAQVSSTVCLLWTTVAEAGRGVAAGYSAVKASVRLAPGVSSTAKGVGTQVRT